MPEFECALAIPWDEHPDKIHLLLLEHIRMVKQARDRITTDIPGASVVVHTIIRDAHPVRSEERK